MTRARRTPLLTAAALGLGTAVALGAPLAASAHVTIDPQEADAGAYTIIQVKVPNESDTTSTVEVALDLPTDTPFTSVRYVPVPGWTAELVTTELPEPVQIGESEVTEAITRVVWTTDGDGIEPGQLVVFPLSVGPVPDVDALTMPATQTYSDGEEVAWSETEADAEHPAPVLYVNAEPADDHHGGGGHDDADSDAAAEGDANAASATGGDSTDVLARVLGVLGLVVGAVGIVIGITGRRRSAA